MLNYPIYLFLLSSILYSSVLKSVIKNERKTFVIELSIDVFTESDLFPTSLLLGLPTEKLPQIKIDYKNETPIPFKSLQRADKGYKWINQQRLKNLETATLHVSPISGLNSYYKNINIQIDFDDQAPNYKTPNKSETEILKNRIINWVIAKDWLNDDKRHNPRINPPPSGRWFKFNLIKDGVYSIPFSSISSFIEDIANQPNFFFNIHDK